MADNLDARASLKISVDGLKELVAEMDRAVQSGRGIDDVWKKFEKTLSTAGSSAKGAASGLKQAGNEAENAAGDWDKLEKKVRDVAAAYKVAARENAAAGKPAPDARAFASKNNVTDADLSNFHAGNSADFFNAAGIKDASASLPRLRYALYDVATTAGIASTAITGIGVASVAAYASMESSFTGVERTLDGVTDPAKVAALRSELVGLSREIPLTFANISEIATLGNQLGIQSQDIAKFTETTAKFSAVTGMTAEASAEAFGSLGELLNVQSRDYEALGSSIALVGRKSVATESEIVAMTTRLAASATKAGFTAQQVVALSGAFASLRIAPERAQGVMEVYFKTLNTAISEGGPKLQAFADITKMSTADVENLVRTDPTAFFTRLATSLGQMDSIAQTGALSQLGLDGIRAGEVFGRVSGNVDVFTRALSDANKGWSEGTELGDQYSKVVDDLASRWEIFLNAVQEAGAAVGATLAPALGVLLSSLTKVLQSFSSFASTPFGTFATGAVVAIAAIVAGITGLAAVGALGLASMAALSTAVNEFTAASGASVLSVRTLGAAISSVGASAGFSAGAIRVFKTALITTGIGALVVLLGTLVAGIVDATTAAQGFSAEAQQLGDSLNRAIEADTAAYYKDSADAVTVYSRKVGDSASETDKATAAAQAAAGVQSDLGKSTRDTTDKISEQIAVLGKQSEALFRGALAKDADFSKFANDPKTLELAKQAGFNVDKMIAEGMSEGGSFTAAVDALRAKADEMHNRINDLIGSKGISDPQTQALMEQELALRAAIDATDGWAASQDEGRRAADAAAGSAAAAGTSLSEMAGGAYSAADGMGAAASGMYDAQSAAIAAQNELFNLGSTLGEGAYQWDIYSEAGRSNLAALYQWMTTVAGQTGATTSGTAANFAAMYQALIDGGVATANQLVFLRNAAASLAGTAFENIKPAQVDFANLFNGIHAGAAKAAKAIGGGGGRSGVTKAVRTLIDYANDLSGVFKRAFDIRFGNQQGLDDITSGWRKIAEDTADAADEMAKYRQTLAELGADRQIKQYFLMVAENYGDQLRATKLRAELADLDNKQADAQKDLSKAQGKANKTLEGNSDAAIDNRKTVLDMVDSYQDLLKTYAANGMSQKDLQAKAAQLKQEFINQAVQAGFSRVEIDKYAASFDDMTLAINRVPRSITVAANINPALQALAEFEAKAKKSGAAAGGGYGSSFGSAARNAMGDISPASPSVLKWQDLGYKSGRAMRQGIINGISVIKLGNKTLMAPGSEADLYGWASGGYTGGGGVSDVAGVVHGQEYVMSAPAVRTLGVNGMNFLHTMLKSGRIPAMGGGGAGGMVELSPYDRSLLMEIANRSGLTITSQTFQAQTNGGNANAAQRRRG